MKTQLQDLKLHEIIAEFVNRMIRIDRAIAMESYVIDVVEFYKGSIVPEKQEISFYSGRGPKRDIESNSQIIRRALDGIYDIDDRLRMRSVFRVSELKTALIMSMAEPYKTECLQALLSPFNVITMTIPEAGSKEDRELSFKFMEKAGGAISTLGLIMENSEFGPEDAKHKVTITSQLTDLKSISDEILGAVHKKVPDTKLTSVT